MGSRIKKIDYFLPERILSNIELENQFPDWDSKKIEDKTGVRERHIAGDDETALDLGYKAAEKVLIGQNKKNIDFLLFCTQSPDYYLPTGACILQNKLGLRTNTGAFDYNLGCSGFVYGLAMAKSLINSGLATEILLITSETYSKHINKLDKSNRTIFGDGAAATIISKDSENKIFEFCLGTDGSGYKNLIVPNGGFRKRFDVECEINNSINSNERTDNDLYMDGPEIFNFTIESVPKVVKEVLEKNKCDFEDIDYFIFHQANKYIIEYLRKKIGIPSEKFYNDLLLTGNTVSASIPLALYDCQIKNKIKDGDLVLLVGFGVGYSWGGTIIKI